MKKTLILLLVMVCGFGFGQSSFNLYNGSSTTVPIPNGTTVSEITTANGETITKVKIKNTSAQTHTYNVIRSIQYQSPALITTSTSTVTPHTYFCFGNSCFDIATNTALPDDYVILLPAGQTATVYPYADNSDDNFQVFKIYFEEGPIMGKYFVKYKVFEVNNPGDSVSFTVKYNEFLGVAGLNAFAESVSEIYPNPTTGKSNINISLKRIADVKIEVYNALGSVLYSSTQKCMAGINKLPVDGSELGPGMYFVSIETEGLKTSKKILIKQ